MWSGEFRGVPFSLSENGHECSAPLYTYRETALAAPVYTPGGEEDKEGDAMNWKLVLQLSIFGLAMGIATVFFIPSKIEPAFWLAIFLVCAYAIARASATRRFLHGLALGIANSVWITSAHIVLSAHYLANHAQEAAMMRSMPLPDSPRLMMAMTGPVVGVVSGVVIGLLALAAGLVVKPAPRPAAG
jgi:hypothetical protein